MIIKRVYSTAALQTQPQDIDWQGYIPLELCVRTVKGLMCIQESYTELCLLIDIERLSKSINYFF